VTGWHNASEAEARPTTDNIENDDADIGNEIQDERTDTMENDDADIANKSLLLKGRLEMLKESTLPTRIRISQRQMRMFP
jgi:uncharacterized Zn ribbon protein